MAGRRGALIVLEGVDRAGKSTQAGRLVAALSAAGRRAELLRFPERSTEIGKLLSSYLEKKSEVEDHSVHLLFSANRWEQGSFITLAGVQWCQPSSQQPQTPGLQQPSCPSLLSSCDNRPLIKEKLSQGVTLVVDRYAFSGVAFTGAKENFSLDWCKQPDVGLPKPDLVLFLQLRLADAARRGEFGQERYEDRAFQERALHCFQQLMGDETVNWKIVDASKSIEDVHEEILALSEDAIRAAAQRPLGELWK
ncbi:thymidylate kinase isoform X1 [Eulemur rufifrons]|uniref:thymidylate kinase isoform X1 n=1 Tax=Eulemur rufifrons TaxID=859984 RepID=UPI003743B6AA